jgi:hypothetical protein
VFDVYRKREDFGLKPPEACLTARVKTLRLAAGFSVISNIQETRACDARVLAVATECDINTQRHAGDGSRLAGHA